LPPCLNSRHKVPPHLKGQLPFIYTYGTEKKFLGVFGRQFISMNISPKKKEAYYTYSLRVGGILHPLVHKMGEA
jgi:hypothetical protein